MLCVTKKSTEAEISSIQAPEQTSNIPYTADMQHDEHLNVSHPASALDDDDGANQHLGTHQYKFRPKERVKAESSLTCSNIGKSRDETDSGLIEISLPVFEVWGKY